MSYKDELVVDKKTKKRKKKRKSNEALNVFEVTKDELKELFLNNEIKDGKTQSCYLYYLLRDK